MKMKHVIDVQNILLLGTDHAPFFFGGTNLASFLTPNMQTCQTIIGCIGLLFVSVKKQMIVKTFISNSSVMPFLFDSPTRKMQNAMQFNLD